MVGISKCERSVRFSLALALVCGCENLVSGPLDSDFDPTPVEGPGEGQPPSDATTDADLDDLDGAALYAQWCAACHNDLAQTDRVGRSADSIAAAIENIAEMAVLRGQLTAGEIAAIAAVLRESTLDPDERFGCDVDAAPSPRVVHRLTRRELEATLLDLLGPEQAASVGRVMDWFPEEGRSDKDLFENAVQSMDSERARSWIAIALELSSILAMDDQWLDKASGSQCGGAVTACVDGLIDNFAFRAFRRPVSELEREILRGALGAPSQQIEILLASILASPRFSYVVEDSAPFDDNGSAPLDEFELASRLSYTLTGSMPSDEIFEAARNGVLKRDYDEWIERALSTAASRTHLEGFFTQWLGVNGFAEAGQPDWFLDGLPRESLHTSIERDFETFVDRVVWERQGSYADLFSSREAVISDPTMAKLYGVEDQIGSGVFAPSRLAFEGSELNLRGPGGINGPRLTLLSGDSEADFQVNWTGGTTVVISIRGENSETGQVPEGYAGAMVRVDGELVGELRFTTPNAPVTATLETTLAPGPHLISIAYSNAFWSLEPAGDRNLRIFEVVVESQGAGPTVVELGAERAGLLTRPAMHYDSFIAPSLVHRGVVLRANLLCREIPPPALDPDDEQLEPFVPSLDMSMREQLEERTAPAACASCHTLINPFAYITQNFDALGRFVDEERVYGTDGTVLATHAIDARAEPRIDSAMDPVVDGAAEMSQALATSVNGPACMVERYFEFATGAAPTDRDSCHLQDAYEELRDGSITGMLRRFASHPNFVRRSQ